jgi:hypothetical protein
MKKKSDGKFPIKKIQSADFDRVGRVRGNKLIFNFGLSITKMSDMSITVICHGMSDCTVSYTSTSILLEICRHFFSSFRSKFVLLKFPHFRFVSPKDRYFCIPEHIFVVKKPNKNLPTYPLLKLWVG